MRFEEDAGLVEVKLLRDGSVITGPSIRAPLDLEVTVREVMVSGRCVRVMRGTIEL